MGDLSKHCPMCGAKPGRPCVRVSDQPKRGIRKGDERPEPHYNRFNDQPAARLIPDEPPYSA